MATVSTSKAAANTPTRTLSPLIFALLIVFSPSWTYDTKEKVVRSRVSYYVAVNYTTPTTKNQVNASIVI